MVLFKNQKKAYNLWKYFKSKISSMKDHTTYWTNDASVTN